MKCLHCSKPAIMHITEVLPDDAYEELHLCEDCAPKYLAEPKSPSKALEVSALDEHEEALALNEQQCDHCKIKFVDFRNSGRLGCPHDYLVFLAELVPLLESIHGSARHSGKTPRRLPQTRHKQQELAQLRKQLNEAIDKERYEEAAALRDRIRVLEQD